MFHPPFPSASAAEERECGISDGFIALCTREVIYWGINNVFSGKDSSPWREMKSYGGIGSV
jgi:hypothetical protein